MLYVLSKNKNVMIASRKDFSFSDCLYRKPKGEELYCDILELKADEHTAKVRVYLNTENKIITGYVYIKPDFPFELKATSDSNLFDGRFNNPAFV